MWTHSSIEYSAQKHSKRTLLQGEMPGGKDKGLGKFNKARWLA